MTDVDTPRSIAAEALGAAFTGPPTQRLATAVTVAEYLERILTLIEAGEVKATEREATRIEGAVLALRAVADREP
ncbi:hypothetical protein ACIGKQ_16550 [Gordonia sp. NPDC062954]|uniref:hypothetical protein n=1 Tax=unclassified Gordonia (in: high G+C Gram-positive bacteria) TaxID=2657482 RepID=UPI00257F860D|nr:hypothetical protein [Gordonia sp. (in: high G+C Gram-positive bacteria)]